MAGPLSFNEVARRRLAASLGYHLASTDAPGAQEDTMTEHEELTEQFERFYAGSRDSNALDSRTKALIGLAVVLTGNCQP